MRRTQFITALVVAIITLVSLHIFVGPRYRSAYYGSGRNWYGGSRYFGPDDRSPDNYDPRTDDRYMLRQVQPRQPADSAGRTGY